jgi:hypothetical protein
MRTQPPPMQFLLLALTITLGSAVPAVPSVHLLTMLQDLGLTTAVAVALAAAVGPVQVGARAVEMAIGRHHHPIWTMIAATVLVAAGIGLLWSGMPLVPVAQLLYGAGIGIASIARGTLPLAPFGAAGYATVMGRLALPSLLAQAGAPAVGVVLMQVIGVQATLTVVLAVAVADVAMVAALFSRSRPAFEERRRASHTPS